MSSSNRRLHPHINSYIITTFSGSKFQMTAEEYEVIESLDDEIINNKLFVMAKSKPRNKMAKSKFRKYESVKSTTKPKYESITNTSNSSGFSKLPIAITLAAAWGAAFTGGSD